MVALFTIFVLKVSFFDLNFKFFLFQKLSPCVVPDLVAGVAKPDRSVAVVACTFPREAKRNGSLVKQNETIYSCNSKFHNELLYIYF